MNITNSVVNHLSLLSRGQGRRTSKQSETRKSIDKSGRKCNHTSRTKEKNDKLTAIGKDATISLTVNVARIVSESDRYLERLARSVRENKSVDEASNFCRWLCFSGVLNLPHPDFKIIRQKVETILHRCGEIYKGGVVKPEYSASDIQAILERLDAIAPKKPFPSIVVEAEAADCFPATLRMLPSGRV